MNSGFIHLHLHTEYSICDGVVRIKPLAETVASAGMPAVAMTDLSNVFGLVKFYRVAVAKGVKPIIGSELWIENPQDEGAPTRLVLLCQNRKGYHNLSLLISRAYQENQVHGRPIVKKAWFAGCADGLIALSAGRESDVGQALINKHHNQAKQLLTFWCDLFPQRFYLELQRTGRQYEEILIQESIKIAQSLQVPVVATNDVRFIARDDFESHEARVCIHEGYVLEDSRRPKNYSEQQYLRTPDEMCELFKDIPEALENTVEIAKRCNFELKLGDYYLPNFPVPEGMKLEEFFEHESLQGLKKRVANPTDEYHQRLKMELDVINSMGFAGYFLIVADFIRWAKENGVPVGPGRGSGAGSLVAYSLGITDLDPIDYELLFERFLNPERVSMPDFDIDFCMEGRDRVIDYVARKYGRQSVSQIITYGTMAARAVVRDVGRVLGHPYGFVDKLAKLVPFEVGMTLTKALQQEDQLLERYQEEGEVRTLLDLAKKLEGLTRNAGKHAGGVVIAPSVLTDFMPLYCEEGGGSLVTQFDKDDVETIGLVKFDFLGLRTLTIINWTLQTIKARHGKDIDIINIPTDDKETFEILKACGTTAVFQLESRGMKDLIRRLQPDKFDEIIALVALFRPGPLQSGMVDDFIDRKHGRARVDYPHPELEPILSQTYGVILYQEQVMQIAQVLAGYSLGSADLLRRAMGKKKPEEMAKHRAIFVEGADKHGVDGKVANYIYDLIEKFAGYGFNKSHSAAYALIAYQTAWLKTHYPAEFMSAVLSSDMDNTDKIVIFYDEARHMGLTLLPPNINASAYKFTVSDKGGLFYGLGAIKGLGEAAIETMIACRETGGSFKSLFDLCQRVDGRKVNRRALEAMICAGALDCFGVERASLMASVDAALKAAEQHQHNVSSGQNDMFGSVTDTNDTAQLHYVQAEPWDDQQRLQAERDSLGLYFSGHPIDRYEKELSKLITGKLAELKPKKEQTVLVAGFVSSIKKKFTKSGRLMAFMTLDDCSARMEIAVFSEVFEESRDLLVKDQLLVIEGDVSVDDYTGGFKLTSKRVMSIDQAREEYAKLLVLKVGEQQLQNGFIDQLSEKLRGYKGGTCAICIDYSKEGAAAKLMLSDEWKIRPHQQLLEQLATLCGHGNIMVTY